MPLKLLHHKSFHVYNAENIARVQRDEARAQLEQEEQDRRTGLADSEARLSRMRATTSLVSSSKKSEFESTGDKKRKRRREENEAEKRLDQHLRGARLETTDKDDDRVTSDRRVDDEPRRTGSDMTDGHLNFWADFEAGAKPTSAENSEKKLERALEQQKLDDLTKMYLAKKGEGDLRGWYATEDGKTEKERRESDEVKLERAYKDGENKRLTDPLATMQAYLRRRTEVLNSSVASSSSNDFRSPATPTTERGDLSPVITKLLAPRRRKGDPIPSKRSTPIPTIAPLSSRQDDKVSDPSLDPEAEARQRVSSERARAMALIAARKKERDGASSVGSTPARSEFGAQGYGMFNREATREAKSGWGERERERGGHAWSSSLNERRWDPDSGSSTSRDANWGEQKRRRDERHERGWTHATKDSSQRSKGERRW